MCFSTEIEKIEKSIRQNKTLVFSVNLQKIDKTYRLLHKFLENLMLIKKKSFKIYLFLLLLNYYLESL